MQPNRRFANQKSAACGSGSFIGKHRHREFAWVAAYHGPSLVRLWFFIGLGVIESFSQRSNPISLIPSCFASAFAKDVTQSCQEPLFSAWGNLLPGVRIAGNRQYWKNKFGIGPIPYPNPTKFHICPTRALPNSYSTETIDLTVGAVVSSFVGGGGGKSKRLTGPMAGFIPDPKGALFRDEATLPVQILDKSYGRVHMQDIRKLGPWHPPCAEVP